MFRNVILTQLVVLVAVAAAWAMRSPTVDRELYATIKGIEQLPEVELTRSEPLQFAPLYDREDLPEIISEEDAAYILSRIRPRFGRKDLRPNLLEHALRAWSLEAKFADPAVLSGSEMADVLMDHGKYLASWGGKAEPLLEMHDQGISIRWGRERSGSVHHDHWLASLTEAGVHLDTPVSALRPAEATAQFGPNGQMTIEHVLREALRDFRLDERETEWTAMAFGLWLPPTKEWVGSGGRIYSFDLLADRLLRGHCEKGVCTGTHRLYSLVLLLRIQEQFPGTLSSETEARITQHMLNVKQWITDSQFEDGHWSSDWSDGADAKAKPRADTLDKQVIATGHHLEWQAIAPARFRLTDDQNRKAFDWLLATMRKNPSHDHILGYYTFYSHVGNAAALWRKTNPAPFWTSWVARHPEADAPAADPSATDGPDSEVPTPDVSDSEGHAGITRRVDDDKSVEATHNGSPSKFPSAPSLVGEFGNRSTLETTPSVDPSNESQLPVLKPFVRRNSTQSGRLDLSTSNVFRMPSGRAITPSGLLLSRWASLARLPELPIPASPVEANPSTEYDELPRIIPGE
ncbi:MAG: hypothetical protein R3C01_05035 [Planctomycetaceae bacterium]